MGNAHRFRQSVNLRCQSHCGPVTKMLLITFQYEVFQRHVWHSPLFSLFSTSLSTELIEELRNVACEPAQGPKRLRLLCFAILRELTPTSQLVIAHVDPPVEQKWIPIILPLAWMQVSKISLAIHFSSLPPLKFHDLACSQAYLQIISKVDTHGILKSQDLSWRIMYIFVPLEHVSAFL